ncbi:MAG: PEGA domain-containing protein, partial [Methanoregula sp.]|nr:PEGA domain-containing protein [Methanoregula sp.]
LVFLLLMVPVGFVSADSPVTTTPERAGGSIYFETSPNDATIWLDNARIGTSPITYFSEKTGTLDVRIQKKGFEEYTGTVTVSDGKRVDFYARLTAVTYDLNAENTRIVPVTTATTIRKSTIPIPTSWPTPTPESPVNPAVIIGATAIGIGFFVIRRR